jgi:hypothetical protein
VTVTSTSIVAELPFASAAISLEMSIAVDVDCELTGTSAVTDGRLPTSISMCTIVSSAWKFCQNTVT